jgi:hypothetical protein
MGAGLKIQSSGNLGHQSVKFVMLLGREIPYFEGHLGSPKLNECHCPLFPGCFDIERKIALLEKNQPVISGIGKEPFGTS